MYRPVSVTPVPKPPHPSSDTSGKSGCCNGVGLVRFPPQAPRDRTCNTAITARPNLDGVCGIGFNGSLLRFVTSLRRHAPPSGAPAAFQGSPLFFFTWIGPLPGQPSPHCTHSGRGPADQDVHLQMHLVPREVPLIRRRRFTALQATTCR